MRSRSSLCTTDNFAGLTVRFSFGFSVSPALAFLMKWIGIDPGKSGAIAVLDDDEMRAETAVFDIERYRSILGEAATGDAFAVVEHVGAMPKQGVSSTFAFGMNFGIIQGMLSAFGIPFELVRPQKWKREFSCTSDKNKSIEVAQRMFPDVSLMRTERCTKPHDGIAEALLMAEYGRRRHAK